MTEEQLKILQARLWAVADILRGRMDPDEYRDYMLGFIFYKHLSEKMAAYADRILAPDGITFDSLDEKTPDHKPYLKAVRIEAVDNLGYSLAPSELFTALAERGRQQDSETGFILEDLRNIFRNIENSTLGSASQDDFDHLFEDIDLSSSRLGRSEHQRNDIIVQILNKLGEIDFSYTEADGDVLGDAYEYLIGEFAASAGKKAGEFYTPKQVSVILTRIVATDWADGTPQTKPRIRAVYDPTCGSGSLLLRFKGEGIEVANYIGQEMNRTTYNLARMNMILHGVRYTDFELCQDDTIEHPAHVGHTFEAVVANPPFSAKWSANAAVFGGDERFSDAPALPPASKADYAFVLHMLYHLADNGTMAVILPHGALFRGGAEGAIRRWLIEAKNWLDAVIGLPANVFFGTSIPACILVCRKCREAADDIMFIDASAHFDKVKNRNLLNEGHIEKIVNTWRTRAEVTRYARPVALDEVAENDFNLNIPRYVDTSEPEELVDLKAVADRLKVIDKDLAENADDLRSWCAELGIAPPFSQEETR